LDIEPDMHIYYENNNNNNNSMGDSKKNTRKTNPKIHERKIAIAFFTLGIVAYVGLFIMGIIQKLKQIIYESISIQE
jgi:hypothetical protein